MDEDPAPETDGSHDAAGRTDGGEAVEGEGEPADHVGGDVDPGIPRWVAAVAPVLLLAVVVAGVFLFVPFGDLAAGEPVPDVTVTQVTLPGEDTMVVHVTNNGPDPVTITQVLVDEAYWSYEMPDNPDGTLDAGESGRIVIPYHWNEGFDYEVALVTRGGATIHHTVVAAQPTPGLTLDLLGVLAVIGLFVGVIPVVLGMLWFPFLRTMRPERLHAVLAFSAGVLSFLAFDAGFEALELAEEVPGFYDGEVLVALGVLGTLLLVGAVGAWREDRVADGDARAASGLWVAYLVALGIGLHNLAEGLAIGSSFALGRASLGAFLVVGFMVHNVTEGPAVVAPVARGERPALAHFAALGVIAGAPVILGGWIGSLAFSPTVGALFLAVGVGAILQVVWEIAGMVRRDGGRVGTAANLLAFGVGLVVMYATDLLVTV